MTPPARSDASRTRTSLAAAASERARADEPARCPPRRRPWSRRSPVSPFQNSRWPRTMSSSAARNVGSSFNPRVRRKLRDPGLRGRLAEELVHLVERLDVVGHEGDRDDEDLRRRRRGRARRSRRASAGPSHSTGPSFDWYASVRGDAVARAARRSRATEASISLWYGSPSRVDELLRDRVRREEEVHRLGARVGELRDLRGDRVGVRLRRRADASARSPTSTSVAPGAKRSTAARERSSAPFVVVSEYCG